MPLDVRTTGALYKACSILHERGDTEDALLILKDVLHASLSYKFDPVPQEGPRNSWPKKYSEDSYTPVQRNLLADITRNQPEEINLKSQEDREAFYAKARKKTAMTLTHRISPSDFMQLMLIYLGSTRGQHIYENGRYCITLRGVKSWLQQFITFHEDDLKPYSSKLNVLGYTMQQSKDTLVELGILEPVEGNRKTKYWISEEIVHNES